MGFFSKRKKEKKEKQKKQEQENQSWLPPLKKFEGVEQNVTIQNFKLIKTLGKGAYGKVVAVKSKLTGNKYALKIISKKMIIQVKMVEQMKNEVNFMRRINHENIIKYIGHFEDETYLFLLLELGEEKHLYQRLKQSGLYKEETAALYLFDIFKAVDYLHNLDPPIIHRDIKPENIIFSEGRLKLVDFGWSNIQTEGRSTFCGTRDYMAPEMVKGKKHDEKLDVWTLGVLAFELMTGKSPFSPSRNITSLDQAKKKLEYNIVNLNVKFPSYFSDEAMDLISQMLRKNRKKRISCAEALKHAFFKRFKLEFNEERERVKNDLNTKKIVEENRGKGDEERASSLGRMSSRKSFLRKGTSGKKFKTPDSRKREVSGGSGDQGNLKFGMNMFKKRKKIPIEKKGKNSKVESSGSGELTQSKFYNLTIAEYSKIDLEKAMEEMKSRYQRVKKERRELASAIKIKNLTISGLEKEIQRLKGNVLICSDTQKPYTKDQIMELEEIKSRYETIHSSNSQLLTLNKQLSDFLNTTKLENDKLRKNIEEVVRKKSHEPKPVGVSEDEFFEKVELVQKLKRKNEELTQIMLNKKELKNVALSESLKSVLESLEEVKEYMLMSEFLPSETGNRKRTSGSGGKNKSLRWEEEEEFKKSNLLSVIEEEFESVKSSIQEKREYEIEFESELKFYRKRLKDLELENEQLRLENFELKMNSLGLEEARNTLHSKNQELKDVKSVNKLLQINLKEVQLEIKNLAEIMKKKEEMIERSYTREVMLSEDLVLLSNPNNG